MTIKNESIVNPKIGDTVSGTKIGRKSRRTLFWSACPDCKTERWVDGRSSGKLCVSCTKRSQKLIGERNSRWKGGIRHIHGYNYLLVYKDNPFVAMASKKFYHGSYRYWVAEHRLVMAQHLGRCLDKLEVIHHLNGIKNDNRIENLEVLSNQQSHMASVNTDRIIKQLETQNSIQASQINLLLFLLVNA
jgi:hypothetical protein